MRVAISTDGDSVSAHFGRCPSFTILDIDNNKVTNRQVLDNPGHHPGAIPKFLHDNGVKCIIAGGMGMNAVNFFNQFGIEIVVGISGAIDDIIKKLEAGSLEGGESLCNPGDGKGYGIDKTACDHPNQDNCDH